MNYKKQKKMTLGALDVQSLTTSLKDVNQATVRGGSSGSGCQTIPAGCNETRWGC